MHLDETIVAIASPTSPAVRGVVRLSGDSTAAVLGNVVNLISGDTQVDTSQISKPTRLDLSIDLGEPIGPVDASVLLWPNRRSYTGQPSAEIHTYGSLPILTAMVDACLNAGARAARPGEFTMRAFLAGRMDLTQAEAVLGVIEAESPGALDSALGQLAGNLSKPLATIRNDLLNLLADVEAGLDFVDEDIEFISDDDLVGRLTPMLDVIDIAAKQIVQRGGGATTTTVVLRGEPNAGKSRLMNVLAGNEAAIVADVAGTTRDVVSSLASINGHRITLQDTAGIEAAVGEISADAQTAGEQVSQAAAIRLWCVDASRQDLPAAIAWIDQQVATMNQSSRSRRVSANLMVATKCDLIQDASTIPQISDWIQCSAETGAGIETLSQEIADKITEVDAVETGSAIGTAARCGQTIQQSRQAIEAAIRLTQNQSGHEFVSAELRTAAQAIGEVTGEIYNEDILDRVFGRFCIGK
ncbi:tRNA modification GTPase MnmE [Rubripirellula obstinata]|uniref:tRNA modification GTPase MnmE n=1 Tax=Rubripirellula obstinata TaxID=406547 RepID=A0A5B1CBI7_9BACT|nr:tRNA modification GTPase [Rubripirellula obstinata]KAA1258467.1 tRNA modification GTPase MnmE [Rubripirellula obstinata]